MNKYIAMRSDLRRKADLIIACENSINKGYADLDLTGVENPAQAIMGAIQELHSKRESNDVAIVVEFMSGDIDLSNGSAMHNYINVGEANVHLIGNNTNIFGSNMSMGVAGANCSIAGFNMVANGNIAALAVANDNITIKNCNIKCSGGEAIKFTNSLQDGETLQGPSNIKILNNILYGKSSGYCVHVWNSALGTIITGNTIISGKLSINSSATYPNTAKSLSQLNVVNIENIEVRKSDIKISDNLHYTIAAPNSFRKEHADLDLTGVADPAQVIMDAIAELDSQRESDDVAIVVEFMGGMITLGSENESMGELNLSDYKNLHIHGNGVTIESKGWDYVYALKIQDCCLYDLNLICYHGMIGIQAVDNCTITNCNVVMESLREGFYVNKSILTNCKATVKNWGEGIWAENSILINCEAETGTIDYSLEGNSIYASKCTLLNCKGVMMGFDYGIYAEDSTITNCFGSSSSYGIYAEGSIVTGGCNGGNGGLLIDGSSYPQDLSIAQNLNFGYIIIQGVND